MRIKQKTQTVRGEIIAVQEHFFRLVTDSGHGLLLTLGRSFFPSLDDLAHYRDTHLSVEVEYQGEPGLESGVAYRVEPVLGQ